MNIDLHDRAALIDAITVGADRPVAFLVGSPLSWDTGGGVPGVDDMLAVAKGMVQAKLPRRTPDFEAAVNGATGATQPHDGHLPPCGIGRLPAAHQTDCAAP